MIVKWMEEIKFDEVPKDVTKHDYKELFKIIKINIYTN